MHLLATSAAILATASICLSACANEPKVLTRTIHERVETPVVVRLDEALTRDCAPDFAYSDTLTVGDALERLKALELALAQCREQLKQIRAAQDAR